jgi:hypothetical protein
MAPSFFDIVIGLFNYFRSNRHRRTRTRRPSRP